MGISFMKNKNSDGYEFLEKISLNKDYHVVLPFAFTTDMVIEIRACVTDYTSGSNTLVGTFDNTDPNGFMIMATGHGGSTSKRGADIKRNGSTYYYSTAYSNTEVYNDLLFKFKANTLYYNSTTLPIQTNNTNSNLVLFSSAFYNSDGLYSDFKGDVYYVKITDANGEKMYLHPVKKDGKIYLYDEVSATLLELTESK